MRSSTDQTGSGSPEFLQHFFTLMSAHLEDLTLADLRLLRLLLQSASLTRSSLTLNWSIPKASHRLSNLREALGDELFVRSGNSLVPTVWMKKLAPRIDRAFEALSALDVQEEFHLEEIDRTFTLEMVDNAAVMLFGPTLAAIRQRAPHFKFSVRASSGLTLENLWEGAIDLAFGADIERELPGDIPSTLLFKSRHVFVMRLGHPLLEKLRAQCGPGGELVATREDLAPWPYISLSLPRWRAISANIDIGWRSEIPSPIYVETPFFLSIPSFLLHSDAYAVLPAELAADFCRRMDLVYVEARPEDLRPWLPKVLWHARSRSDFALQWLRCEIVQCYTNHVSPPRAHVPDVPDIALP